MHLCIQSGHPQVSDAVETSATAPDASAMAAHMEAGMSTIDTTWKLDPPIPLGWHRLGGLFGLAMFVLTFVGTAIGDPNDISADLNPDQPNSKQGGMQ